MSNELFPQLHYCVRCCFPETEEGTSFDESGICRVCQSSEHKMHINWAERERQLRAILDEAKAKAGNNYDCILPISGGKDSMFQAYVLTKVFGMKPLAVTFNHNWYSETGWYNLMNLLETFNLDHIMFTPNRNLVNRLAKKSVTTIGDTCWSCHSGCGAFPLQVAARFNIPLLIYGESVAENSGRATYREPHKYDREYFTKVSAKKTPDEIVCEEISSRDVFPYQLPSAEECEAAGVKGIHLGDYMFWDHERQMEFVRDVYGWRETDIENSYKHYKSAECIMPGMHDFTCYLKRGFGRATSESCIDVRNGLATRCEAQQLIKRNDPTRPLALDYYLQITGMTEEEFYSAMEKLRLSPLAGEDVPVLPKTKPHGERVLPFVQQLIKRLKKTDSPHYITEKVIDGPMIPKGQVLPDVFMQMSARRIIEGYLKKEFTPLEVAEACIKRIQDLDSRFLAMEAFDPDYLLEQAKEAQDRLEAGHPLRKLEAIPVGVKDIYNTKVLPTQMGSVTWKGFEAGNDARLVAYFKWAGGLIAGKTVTAEFAVHAQGKTLNPYDPALSPGTSSSGSSVGVAVGMFPLALGSQTAGSIIRPASFCGVYGFKPSFGLFPRTGTLKTTDSLDTLGFLAAHLDDLELFFDVLRVRGSNYPFSHAALNDLERQRPPRDRPWKIALLKTYTWDKAEEYARNALLDWAKEIDGGTGTEIVEVKLPPELEKAHNVHATIYDFALAYYFKEEAKFTDEISPLMQRCMERGKGITADQYHHALEEQEELIRIMDKFMLGFDAGISLSTAHHAPLREVEESPDPALIWTLTHLPALSAPVFTSPKGLPFGAQIFARKYNDLLLFRFVDHLRSRGLIPGGVNPLVDI